jgi:hypothetical protein
VDRILIQNEPEKGIQRTLVQHKYAGLDKSHKGLVRRYLAHMTGLKRAQLTRLIA